jgi:hypothetical protein
LLTEKKIQTETLAQMMTPMRLMVSLSKWGSVLGQRRLASREKEFAAMKAAETMLNELILHVPKGCTVTITERPSSRPTDPNWVAGSGGGMDPQQTELYQKKVAELRKTDTIIDWSGVETFNGPRRISRAKG